MGKFFLPRENKSAASELYSICRFFDDLADDSNEDQTKLLTEEFQKISNHLDHPINIFFKSHNISIKILGDLVQVRPGRKPHTNNMSITYTPLCDSNYNTYDKNNIINEDKFYIYYKNKVWSKCVDDYLRIQETSKRKYVMIRDVNNNNKPYAYTIS